jgi:universal stress protein E
MKFRRILVCVGEAKALPATMLRKVATLARATGARVELFHALRPPAAAGTSAEDAAASCLRQLDKAAGSAQLRGIRVDTAVALDHPPHEAVVRRVMTETFDLVIASARPRPARFLVLRHTDWELIRHCPAPLLLVKSTRDYTRPAIVVAVDPFHANAKPANLDARLLEGAGTLASALGGSIHLFHSFMPVTTFVPAPGGVILPVGLPPEMEATHTVQISRALDALAERANIPKARRHLHMGAVPAELAAVVRRTRAGLVVMGAVSRSGLKRLLIGNTAERALDELSCDVLIVKPANFKSAVPARPAGRRAAHVIVKRGH